MNLFCALEIFFGGKDGKNVMGAKIKLSGFLFFFFSKKLPSDLEIVLIKLGLDYLSFN